MMYIFIPGLNDYSEWTPATPAAGLPLAAVAPHPLRAVTIILPSSEILQMPLFSWI